MVYESPESDESGSRKCEKSIFDLDLVLVSPRYRSMYWTDFAEILDLGSETIGAACIKIWDA